MDQIGKHGLTFCFGPFRFDTDRQTLWRNGTLVPLGSRAARVLDILLTRAPHIACKTELMDAVWEGLAVEDSNLTVQISALRRILGQKAWIVTVARRGYRFGADVRRETTADRTPAEEKPKPSSSLALQPTSFVGRGADMAKLRELVRGGRLVTLVGAGGVGKTRLALQVAAACAQTGIFLDGIHLVELGSLQHPGQVTEAFAAVFGLSAVGAEVTAESLAAYLEARHILLILDSCEHRVGQVAMLVNAFLRRCPEVALLATSRERLAVAGEYVYQVSCLACPPDDDSLDATTAQEYAAVQLFVQRADAVLGGYALSDADARSVARLCRHLDGLPLAIELVAPRLRLFAPEELLSRLTKGLGLLSGSDPNASPVHVTLRATLDWSYELLSDAERALFRRLSVYGGSFSAETVTELLGSRDREDDTVALLASLLDKSLVAAAPGPKAKARFRLLETTRQYALEKLIGANEQDWHRRQAAFWADFFETAERQAHVTAFVEWLEAYRYDIDNLRASLDWAFGPAGDRLLGTRLIASTTPLWRDVSLRGEQQSWLAMAVASLTPETPPLIAGRIWFRVADGAKTPAGERLHAALRAVALLTGAGDTVLLAYALITAANAASTNETRGKYG